MERQLQTFRRRFTISVLQFLVAIGFIRARKGVSEVPEASCVSEVPEAS